MPHRPQLPPSTSRLAAALVLAAAALAHANAPVPTATPAALEGLDARAAVEVANAWKGNGVTSFATTEAVHFAFPDGAEVTVPLSDEAVLVSLAPYVNHTHPCTTHYMSGCQGELVDVGFAVRAVLADGTPLFDEILRTGANGFLDLWLPRDQVVLLSFSAGGYAADAVVATHAGSPTCITTVRLARAGS